MILSDKLEYGKVRDSVYFNVGFKLDFTMSNYQDDEMLKVLSNTLKEQFGEDRIKEVFDFKTNCDLQEVGQDVWLMNNNKPTTGKIYERNSELNRADSKTVIITYTVKLPSGEYVKTKEVFKTKDDLFISISKELYNV